MDIFVVLGILFGSLVSGWVGWKMLRVTRKIGQVATSNFNGQQATDYHLRVAGTMQLSTLALALPMLLVGVLGTSASVFELVERQVKSRAARTEALERHELNKQSYAQMNAKYEKVKSTIPVSKRKMYAVEMRRLQWYAMRSPDEVVAEADQYRHRTFLSKLWRQDVDKYNMELGYELALSHGAKARAYAQSTN